MNGGKGIVLRVPCPERARAAELPRTSSWGEEAEKRTERSGGEGEGEVKPAQKNTQKECEVSYVE